MIEYYKNLSLENLFYTDENGIVQEEEWRDIPKFIGKYKQSTLSRVKSLERIAIRSNKTGNYKVRECILKQWAWGNGRGDYLLAISLCEGGLTHKIKIHQLMGIVFLNHIPDRTHNTIVDHKDNNDKNNILSNLQIITQRKNTSKDKNFETKSSKYTGVCWNKKAEKWQVNMKVIKGTKSSHLYQTSNEDLAGLFYQTAVDNLDKFNGCLADFRKLIKELLNIK